MNYLYMKMKKLGLLVKRRRKINTAHLIMGKIQSDKGKVQRLNDFHYLAQVAEEITNEPEN